MQACVKAKTIARALASLPCAAARASDSAPANVRCTKYLVLSGAWCFLMYRKRLRKP
jgi:hypothetical protein